MTETYPLYNGEVLLHYNPGNHHYTVEIKGRRFSVPSVTRALEAVSKPALIPWAVKTTIEFIRPAITPGVEHAESYLEEVYSQAKCAFRATKQVAADVGTQAHAILERYPDCGTPGDDPVGRCVGGAVDWLESAKVEFIERERAVYSRRHKFSGRFDGLAKVGGSLALIDYKTSNGIYPEYRFQAAAYVKAYEEEHPDVQIEQRILLRLGKEDGAFEPHIYYRDSLRKDFEAFLCALKIHRRLEQIKSQDKKEEGLIG